MHVIIRFEKLSFILLSATFCFKTHQKIPYCYHLWIKSNHFCGKYKSFTIYPQICLGVFPPLHSFTLCYSHSELLPNLFRNPCASLKSQRKYRCFCEVFLYSSWDCFPCVPTVYQSGLPKRKQGKIWHIHMSNLRTFPETSVTGQQMQAAHGERSGWVIQYFTSCLSLCLICHQGPHWLSPTGSQRAKEPIDTVQPPQGKEHSGEELRVAVAAGWTQDIQTFLLTLNWHSVATTCCRECFPTRLWPCHLYLQVLFSWRRI